MSEPISAADDYDGLLRRVHDSTNGILEICPGSHPASLAVWPWYVDTAVE